MKMQKKFYVGSRNTIESGDWTRATEAEAIAHAKELLEDSGETQYIVKVIAVVKQQSVPVRVEKVI